MRAACDAAGIALVPLVAPTTPDERLARIGAQRARLRLHGLGRGTTGERAALADDVRRDRRARRARTREVPVAVGFGIGTPGAGREAADAGADGVIVGAGSCARRRRPRIRRPRCASSWRASPAALR